MFELVRDELQELADKKGITKEELKNIIKKNQENDPVRKYQANFRYKLQPLNVVWDKEEKEYIYFKNDRQAEKWKKEHKDEFCIDY